MTIRHPNRGRYPLRPKRLPHIFKLAIQRAVGMATWKYRSLPKFVIIGAQRCGTTSLFHFLSKHPQIYPSYPKETHYFSNKYKHGLNWYRSFFPFQFRPRANEKKWIAGEATPYYLFHPLASERIHRELPNVKLIILIRNPIDRALSHYHHEVKSGFESLSFKQAILEEEHRIYGERDRIITDHHYRSFAYQHYTYLKRGVYLNQIKQWEKFFTHDQMLILISEVFFADPASILDQICRFLGLTRINSSVLRRYNDGQYPPMDAETRQMLRDYFKPHNQRLEDHLNVVLNWER